MHCDKICAVLAGKDWKAVLNTMKERIVFIDEGNAFVYSTEIVEDSNAGFEFYKRISADKKWSVISASGKNC